MPQQNNQKHQVESTSCPMDIDIQNAQINAKKQLPSRDTQGHPRCFYCNNYGHVKEYCRKFAASRHHQNAQIQLVDSTSLADIQENINAGR